MPHDIIHKGDVMGVTFRAQFNKTGRGTYRDIDKAQLSIASKGDAKVQRLIFKNVSILFLTVQSRIKQSLMFQ